MEEYYPIIAQSDLFQGIPLAELPELIQTIGASLQTFPAGTRIWHAGEQVSQFGLVLAGSVQVIKEDVRGNRTILNLVEPSDVFGEAYAYGSPDHLPVSVDVSKEATILFLPPQAILSLTALPGGTQVLNNLLKNLAQKSLFLNQRIEILAQRKIHDKVLTFLHSLEKQQQTNHLVIPYNRQEMADFLGVERSALSNALSEMKKAGMLDYHKNNFTLLDK